MRSAIASRCPAPGGNWPLEIVGIYADYGNPKGQIAVNFAALTRRFPQTPQTAVRPARRAGKDRGADHQRLQKKFRLDERSVADQATMKAESKRIFNRTFAVTAALNTFTLGVAGIALLTSLLTLGQPAVAATGAAVGDRRHAAAARARSRLAEDHVGGADHRAARAAARVCWWLVPDRGGQRVKRSAGGCRSTSFRCN